MFTFNYANVNKNIHIISLWYMKKILIFFLTLQIRYYKSFCYFLIAKILLKITSKIQQKMELILIFDPKDDCEERKKRAVN